MSFLSLKRVTFFLLLSGLALWLGGCTTMTKQFSQTTGDLQVGVTDKRPDPMGDLAPGGYPIEGSNVLVTKTQGGEETVGPAIFFGGLGAGIANADLIGAAKKMVQGQEKALSLNLFQITNKALKGYLAQHSGRFNFQDQYKDADLQITPYLDLNVIDDTHARLWTVLKVQCPSKGWGCRYIVGTGKPREFSGKEGWLFENGQHLREDLNTHLKIAFQTIFDDLDGKLRNKLIPRTWFRGRWLYYKDPHQANVQVLRRTKDFIVVLPYVEDDEMFAGINVLPPDFEEWEGKGGAPAPTPATANDGPMPTPTRTVDHW